MYLDCETALPDDDEYYRPHFEESESDFAPFEDWDDFDSADE